MKKTGDDIFWSESSEDSLEKMKRSRMSSDTGLLRSIIKQSSGRKRLLDGGSSLYINSILEDKENIALRDLSGNDEEKYHKLRSIFLGQDLDRLDSVHKNDLFSSKNLTRTFEED